MEMILDNSDIEQVIQRGRKNKKSADEIGSELLHLYPKMGELCLVIFLSTYN